MTFVVDTNVPVVANWMSLQASPECVLACLKQIQEIMGSGRLALDEGGQIIAEYFRHLNRSGHPGVGDAFAKWLFNNQWYPERCDHVRITPSAEGYVEFPADERLAAFDRDDRKFVAVSIVHAERPPILNAVDSDWRDFAQPLAEHGVTVHFLCADF